MIIPIAPGGQTDVVARLLQLTIDKRKLLPQPIVVINNAAAGGTTGTRQVKESEPDGYTIGVFHMGLLTAPAMGVVDYDHGAFELIGQIGRTQVGMGGLADGRFKTIQDVLAEAKAKPDTMTVAMNIGLLPHFVPLMFQQDAGIRFRYVQSGGGAVRLKSVLGKHTELSLFSGPEFLLFQAQGIKPLVMFSEARAAGAARCSDRQGDRHRHGVRGAGHRVRAQGHAQGPPRRDRCRPARGDGRSRGHRALQGSRHRRVFIDGAKLRGLLDGLKGPITKVGDAVRQGKGRAGREEVNCRLAPRAI